MKRRSRWLVAMMACALAAFAIAPAGCDGSTLAAPNTTPDPLVDPDSSTGGGGGDSDTEAGADANPANDAAPPTFGDGTPTRVACSKTLGAGLTPDHGRLDGELVSVLTASQRGCPNDDQHLHLQVRMNGAVYDIAVNLDGLEGETDAKLPGSAFAEGWHPMGLEYVKDFGLHSTALTLTGAAAIRARVELELTNANHISVFGYGYPGSDGAHLIHRSGAGNDGALVLNPLAAKAHVLAFRFSTDTF